MPLFALENVILRGKLARICDLIGCELSRTKTHDMPVYSSSISQVKPAYALAETLQDAPRIVFNRRYPDTPRGGAMCTGELYKGVGLPRSAA